MLHPNNKFYIKAGIIFWILAVTIVVLPSWPYIYYRLSPQTSEILASTLASTAFQDKTINISPNVSLNPTPPIPTAAPKPLPPIDLSLPKENGLIINKIGIRGAIHEGDDWENILKSGIWRVPNFATPENPDKGPIILAAHRFGYLAWSNQFRQLNSFYNLPKLQINDEISIVWNQREYKYQIYAENTGEKINDYSADLILYTCQLWNSPVRVFKFAKRV